MATEVIIEQYNEKWTLEFEKEKQQIQQVLQNNSVIIEHIGSTSIVGLPSKPIIDIAIVVTSLDEADLFIEPLSKLNYEYVPKVEFPYRRFFRKGEWRKGTHHLHVYELNSDEWSNKLLFRDYLRTHPDKLLEYAKLKEHLALRFSQDREAYTNMKGPFILSILEKAKKKSD